MFSDAENGRKLSFFQKGDLVGIGYLRLTPGGIPRTLPSSGHEHKSERFAFGYVLYWLAHSNRFQTGCSLRERWFFRDFYFVSEK
uniref:Uncharacterized protein n=1 Tax=Candidatus Kentrum sp. SD TaxID=2126332 RepID=A0A450Z5X2_9GAMM|nr:MAG: hypothetical protein BECKSD772E_GA0070983_11617 [Candidatus Kentron sp. SD]VFK80258.1 MAG: hypothetical protein BECKSD772D_GA0070982_10975 [Candidatus Kentron sp. SD]